MNTKKETIEAKECTLLLDAAVGIMEHQTTEAYYCIDLTGQKYNACIYSRDEKEIVTLRTRNNNLLW
jgi:hypothetical protein